MPPIISIVGKSGSGKTTFIERLIPELKNRGYKIGTIKHTCHNFEFDKPGKDSWRHKRSGADTVIIASDNKFSMVKDIDSATLNGFKPYFKEMDIVITEGYKNGNKPKIEIIRSGRSTAPLNLKPEERMALVTDTDVGMNVPRFGLEDIAGVADLIEKKFL
ncbi:MAG: molybdopterin-guanine dinucleotide biosynthesis protein B [Deltaproteobacteria bacterium]|nr:molybdopterin-guanine dinucleotide biosynthesis protein B [Deltaproteobacteria bacterium]